MSQFKRKYRFVIGEPYTLNLSPVTSSSERVESLEKYYNDIPTNGLILSEHHCKFSISNQVTTNKNKSSITFSNLSDDIVKQLESMRDKSLAVKFEVGFEDEGLQEIFNGVILRVSDKKLKQLRETTLSLGDGTKNLNEAMSSRTYARGTSSDIIVKDLLSDLGLPNSKQTPLNSSIQLGRTYSGPTKDLLKMLAEDNDYIFCVVDSKSIFTPRDAAVGIQAALLTPETGLLTSPEIETGNLSKTQASSRNSEEYQVEFLLNPTVKVDSHIYIKDSRFDSACKVLSINYVGDSEGNAWRCTAKVLKTDKIIK